MDRITDAKVDSEPPAEPQGIIHPRLLAVAKTVGVQRRAILERGREVEPIVIGKGALNPPTKQYSGLDQGDVFAVPNNRSSVSVENPLLEPESYGLDFWGSSMDILVTIENPRAVGRPNQYGDTWVVGNWSATGDNDRTSLTVSAADGNPEAIIIGSPLDGSKNTKDTKLGDRLETIVSILYYAFGFYRILPLTNITVVESVAPETPPSTSLDDNGETNDGPVSAGKPHTALTTAVQSLSSTNVTYKYTYISPLDGKSGGAPGGNVRVAYLYRADRLRLRKPNPGNATTANEVLSSPELKYSPGYTITHSFIGEILAQDLSAAIVTLGDFNEFVRARPRFHQSGASYGREHAVRACACEYVRDVFGEDVGSRSECGYI
ncbi:hypothetical protein F5Y11DRAFT_367111 [Daldinia sp. FL1419]|nr:hypothetical protein F5Y11DRAFT_367111 [Daldinia sp. FL1419]